MPDSPVTFEVMADERLLRISGGAAFVTDSAGNETVVVDPSRATEYMVAHEIMHAILHRSGWPRMWCIVPEDLDPFARRLADEVDSSFDHLKFDPQLETLGFDVKAHREAYLSGLQSWPTTKISGPDVLWNGLKVWDALLWGSSFRSRVLQVTSLKQPESSELARQLLARTGRARNGTKQGIRLGMVDVLDFLEKWIIKTSGQVQNLRHRIGISPVFTKGQLRTAASRTVVFQSHPVTLNSQPLWLGGLALRTDDTRFRNYACVGALSEPPEFEAIRENLGTLTLDGFIEAEKIRTYSTLP